MKTWMAMTAGALFVLAGWAESPQPGVGLRPSRYGRSVADDVVRTMKGLVDAFRVAAVKSAKARLERDAQRRLYDAKDAEFSEALDDFRRGLWCSAGCGRSKRQIDRDAAAGKGEPWPHGPGPHRRMSAEEVAAKKAEFDRVLQGMRDRLAALEAELGVQERLVDAIRNQLAEGAALWSTAVNYDLNQIDEAYKDALRASAKEKSELRSAEDAIALRRARIRRDSDTDAAERKFRRELAEVDLLSAELKAKVHAFDIRMRALRVESERLDGEARGAKDRDMSVFNLYVFEELERKSSPEVGISAALVRRLNFNRLTFLWETSLESYGAFYLMGAIPGPDDPPQLGEAAANLLARFLGVEAVVLRGGAVRVVRSGAFGQPATLGAFASSAAPGGPKPGVEATPRTEGVTGASELLKAERERRRAEEAAAEHLSSGKAKPSR